MEEYDPDTDTWRARAPLRAARRQLGVVGASNGTIYAIGGWPQSGAVDEYDPVTDSWAEQTPLPRAAVSRNAAQGTNGRIYFRPVWTLYEGTFSC